LIDAEIRHQAITPKTPRAISFDQYYRHEEVSDKTVNKLLPKNLKGSDDGV
jgi:hypothetical protein